MNLDTDLIHKNSPLIFHGNWSIYIHLDSSFLKFLIKPNVSFDFLTTAQKISLGCLSCSRIWFQVFSPSKWIEMLRKPSIRTLQSRRFQRHAARRRFSVTQHACVTCSPTSLHDCPPTEHPVHGADASRHAFRRVSCIRNTRPVGLLRHCRVSTRSGSVKRFTSVWSSCCGGRC